MTLTESQLTLEIRKLCSDGEYLQCLALCGQAGVLKGRTLAPIISEAVRARNTSYISEILDLCDTRHVELAEKDLAACLSSGSDTLIGKILDRLISKSDGCLISTLIPEALNANQVDVSESTGECRSLNLCLNPPEVSEADLSDLSERIVKLWSESRSGFVEETGNILEGVCDQLLRVCDEICRILRENQASSCTGLALIDAANIGHFCQNYSEGRMSWYQVLSATRSCVARGLVPILIVSSKWISSLEADSLLKPSDVSGENLEGVKLQGSPHSLPVNPLIGKGRKKRKALPQISAGDPVDGDETLAADSGSPQDVSALGDARMPLVGSPKREPDQEHSAVPSPTPAASAQLSVRLLSSLKLPRRIVPHSDSAPSFSIDEVLAGNPVLVECPRTVNDDWVLLGLVMKLLSCAKTLDPGCSGLNSPPVVVTNDQFRDHFWRLRQPQSFKTFIDSYCVRYDKVPEPESSEPVKTEPRFVEVEISLGKPRPYLNVVQRVGEYVFFPVKGPTDIGVKWFAYKQGDSCKQSDGSNRVGEGVS